MQSLMEKKVVFCSECGKPLYSEESMKAGMGKSCRHKKENPDEKYEIEKRSIEQIIASIMQGDDESTNNAIFCVNKGSFIQVMKFHNQTFISPENGIGTMDVKKHFQMMNGIKYIRKILGVQQTI